MRVSRILTVAAALCAAAAVQAQSASIQATATVVTPLVVTGSAPLAFGSVFQGVAKTILHSDATSGRLSITGFGTSQVAMTFTLPGTLASGANTMPINNYDIRINGTNTPTGASVLTVVSGTPVNANLVANSLFVFVGGRVQPVALQAAGTYTGTIVLAAAYTGL